jgi:hypothetical protein
MTELTKELSQLSNLKKMIDSMPETDHESMWAGETFYRKVNGEWVESDPQRKDA